MVGMEVTMTDRRKVKKNFKKYVKLQLKRNTLWNDTYSIKFNQYRIGNIINNTNHKNIHYERITDIYYKDKDENSYFWGNISLYND